MKLSEEKRIDAPRERVWAGLNDAAVLEKAIPGCESLEKVSDTEFTATVSAKVGPVKAKFKGSVTLSDLNPPESYRISGEGKGGAAGFAKGGATITLVEDGDGTILKYDVDADVGGKLAQLGGRLLEGTSKKLAGEFFDNFEKALQGDGEEAAPEPAPAPEVVPEATSPAPEPINTPQSGAGNKTWAIIGVIAVLTAIALTLWR